MRVLFESGLILPETQAFVFVFSPQSLRLVAILVHTRARGSHDVELRKF